MQLGIICLDAAGTVRAWNHHAARILGWTFAGVASRPLPVELHMLRCLDETESPIATMRLPTKNGESVDVRVHKAPWCDASGRDGTVVALLDASSGQALEGKLLKAAAQIEAAREEARSAQRFRDLLEAAPDAILETDGEGRIAMLNRGAEKMFGYTREELLGAPVEVLVPEATRGRHHQHRQEAHTQRDDGTIAIREPAIIRGQ